MKLRIYSAIFASVLLLSACGKNNDTGIYGTVDIEESKSSSLSLGEESYSSRNEIYEISDKKESSNNDIKTESSKSKEFPAEEVSSSESKKEYSTKSDPEINYKEKRKEITIQTQKNIYPEKEKITEIFFKVTNNTKKDINLSQIFRMQKYDEKKEEWVPMKTLNGKYSGKLNDYQSVEIAKAGTTYYVSADIEDFLNSESRNYGKYRIEIFAHDKSFYGDFEIGREKQYWSEEDVSAYTRYGVYPPNAKYIDYEINNSTDYDLTYNDEYDIFKYDVKTGEWKNYPCLKNVNSHYDVLYTIPKKESVKKCVKIENVYKTPLERGKYKIVKFIGDKQIEMYFEVDDKISKFDKELIKKVQKNDEFQKAKFKRYNFSSPMNYQGLMSEKLNDGSQIYIFYLDGNTQLNNQMKLISGGGYAYKIFKDSPFYTDTEIKYNKEGDLKPHFFTTTSEIILYYGKNQDTINSLEEQFGKEYRVK